MKPLFARMHIQDYFKNLQSYKLSDAQKNLLYERILSQTQKSHRTSIFTSKHFFTKVVGYTILLICIGLTIYIPYLGQRQAHTPQTGSVLANYIANIVQAQGNFYISSDGHRIDGNNISDGDTVILSSGGSLVFHVSGQIEGKITGPASFMIHRRGSGYTINMLQGDYIEVAALGEKTPELAVVSSDNKITTTSKAGDKYHFVVTTKNNKQIVLNKAEKNISVTTTNNTGPKTTLVAWKNAVTVTSEGNITLAENQLFATTSKKQDIPMITKEDDGYANSFFNSLLATAEHKDQIMPQADTRVMMTEEQGEITNSGIQSRIDRKSLRNNLIPQFVWVDLKYLTYYYLDGQQLEYQRSFDTFLQRIQRTYTALGVAIPTIEQLHNDAIQPFLMSNLLHLVANLSNNLPNEIPENDKNTIRTLAVFLTKLSKYKFGQFAGENLYLEDMFKKINQ